MNKKKLEEKKTIKHINNYENKFGMMTTLFKHYLNSIPIFEAI